MGAWKHRVLSVDETNQTVNCQACGTVRGVINAGRYVCSIGREENRQRDKYPRSVYKYNGTNRTNRVGAHGLTNAQRLERIQAVGGCCEICGSDLRLVIDHSHVTGRVRGVLCGNCNTGIGMLGDSPERVQRAANYLARAADLAASSG